MYASASCTHNPCLTHHMHARGACVQACCKLHTPGPIPPVPLREQHCCQLFAPPAPPQPQTAHAARPRDPATPPTAPHRPTHLTSTFDERAHSLGQLAQAALVEAKPVQRGQRRRTADLQLHRAEGVGEQDEGGQSRQACQWWASILRILYQVAGLDAEFLEL